MRGIYGGFETWLNKYGKEITVAKNLIKTLHSVIARWTLKDECKLGKSAELESNESEVEEDKGSCSDKGTNLLSRTWSREKRARNNDRYDNRWCNSKKRKNNMNSSNSEDGEDSVSGRGSRERLAKRQQGWKGN
jgi:hypothetical protein